MSYHVKRVREPDPDADPEQEPGAAPPEARGPLLAGVPDPGEGPARGGCLEPRG